MISPRHGLGFPLPLTLALLVALLDIASPASVHAQPFDIVGTRALGMSGAFVAVVDDASATWWNPAGLPNSLIIDGIAEGELSKLVNESQRPIPDNVASKDTSGGIAFAFPAVGLSYFRTRQSRLEPAIAGATPGREEGGIPRVGRSLLLHQVGVSLAHSLGDAIVIGATVRVIKGELSTLVPAEGTAEDVFEAIGEVEGASRVRGDVDLGVLVRVARVRFGLAARNLTNPSFPGGSSGAEWRLERQARIGAALVADGDRAGRHDWVVAVDGDLRQEMTPAGERRDLAFGGERWFRSRRLGLRAGVSASTAGDVRPAVSGGASVAVAGGFWVEGRATRGSKDAVRGWGLAAHLMF
jgi:hypothetical protein